jgi:hypothetical protein
MFDKGRPDEVALAEMEAALGPVPVDEPLDVVCDDCWEVVNPRKHPEIVAATKEIFAARRLGIKDGAA